MVYNINSEICRICQQGMGEVIRILGGIVSYRNLKNYWKT